MSACTGEMADERKSPKKSLRRREISKSVDKKRIYAAVAEIPLKSRETVQSLPRGFKDTPFGALYSPRRANGDCFVLTGDKGLCKAFSETIAWLCPGLTVLALSPTAPIEQAEDFLSARKRTLVIKCERGERSGLYAFCGTAISGAAAVRYTYRTETAAKEGEAEIKNLCAAYSDKNFRAAATRTNAAVTTTCEFFDFVDFERFTVAAAKTLKGDELVETLYAYDAPFQDEELLSLTRATIEEKSPELTRLGYYPLLTGRTVMTTFVCGADGDCSPVAELIYTILTEEQL